MSFYGAEPVVPSHNCVDLSLTEPEVPLPCLGQEKGAIEHSIPLGKRHSLKLTTADESLTHSVVIEPCLNESTGYIYLSSSLAFQTLVSVLKIKHDHMNGPTEGPPQLQSAN